MAKAKWMQKAFGQNKGALHRMLGIPEDETIPESTLQRASKSDNKLLRRRALAALVARAITKRRFRK